MKDWLAIAGAVIVAICLIFCIVLILSLPIYLTCVVWDSVLGFL